jgi:hypothetical protein
MNQKQKHVSINNDLLSYKTIVRGDWLIKASVYKDEQVMLIGFDRTTSEFFTKMFHNYHQVVAFLDYLQNRSGKVNKMGFPDD